MALQRETPGFFSLPWVVKKRNPALVSRSGRVDVPFHPAFAKCQKSHSRSRSGGHLRRLAPAQRDLHGSPWFYLSVRYLAISYPEHVLMLSWVPFGACGQSHFGLDLHTVAGGYPRGFLFGFRKKSNQQAAKTKTSKWCCAELALVQERKHCLTCPSEKK